MPGKSNIQHILAIDIGGSGIKALVVDPGGEPITERRRHPTPHPSTPQSILGIIHQLIRELAPFARVSVGFPGVVIEGRIVSAPHLHASWIGFPLAETLQHLTGTKTRVANDADIQGLGVVAGEGVELVLTLGTGLGSALFTNGRLVPNLELAHHPFRQGKTYEECLGNAARKALGHRKWNRRLQEAIELLNQVFNFRRLYLGGGNSGKITLDLPDGVQVVSNIAGLLGGAALWRRTA